MKLTLVGHACWLVETADVRIIFDPLLFDPNQANCYEVHPTRRVCPEGLGPVDVVVVSHRHIDHFDVRSLSRMPKTATVLCPNDNLVIEAVRAIGFAGVRVTADWDCMCWGGTTLRATPSLNSVPEQGFVVFDAANAIWNQVDSQVAPATAERIRRFHGRLDVVIAPWQPLLELKFQLNEGFAFPHAAYAEMLARAGRCNARMWIPGASGLRYLARSSWLNRIAYPVARDRFATDLRAALPAGDARFEKADPGDEIECDGPTLRLCQQASRFVSSHAGEDQLVAFCPVDPFQSLFKEKPVLEAAEAGIAGIIDDLGSFITKQTCDEGSPLQAFRRWRVVYQLIVCFERGNAFVHWNFAGDAVAVEGWSTRANATAIISGKALCALAEGACSWEEACHSGEWRYFESIAAVSPEGYRVPQPGEVEDLLRLRFPYSEFLHRFIAAEVERWKSGRREADAGLPADAEPAARSRPAR